MARRAVIIAVAAYCGRPEYAVKKWVVVAVLAWSACQASVIVQSTFNTGDEGWRVGDLTGTVHLVTPPAYLAGGGNPGGFIRTQDVFVWTAFTAPASFLGDMSAAYGGQLHFDQRELANSGGPAPAVALQGAGLQLGHAGVMPGTAWTTIVVPLTPGGWVNGATLAPATAEEIRAALSSLTALWINADYLDGADQVDLDNVALLTAVPEPGTAALLAAALGLLAAVSCRRSERRGCGPGRCR
jgi:hypothetical protein